MLYQNIFKSIPKTYIRAIIDRILLQPPGWLYDHPPYNHPNDHPILESQTFEGCQWMNSILVDKNLVECCITIFFNQSQKRIFVQLSIGFYYNHPGGCTTTRPTTTRSSKFWQALVPKIWTRAPLSDPWSVRPSVRPPSETLEAPSGTQKWMIKKSS